MRSAQIYQEKLYRRVGGFLEFDAALLTRCLDAVQREYGVTGGVAEIGVHHGRYFILLDLLRRDGEIAVAIDVFGQQHLNQDQSGKGDRAQLETNLARYGSALPTEVIEADSLSLTPQSLPGPFRFFSVDGGHTSEHVVNDLRLAEATLARGGIVMLDDIFNQPWCEVVYGFARYKESAGSLIPFAVFGGKLFLTNDSKFAAEYRFVSERVFMGRYHLVEREFFDNKICTHFPNIHPRVRFSFWLQRSALGKTALKVYHWARA